MSVLTFEEVTRINLERCNRWHKNGIQDWTPERWGNAVTGEWGEACNALKKLHRVQDGMANISEAERQISSEKEALAAIGAEIADTFLYLNLFATRLGLSLSDEVVKKFNETSVKYGFPERLGQ